MSVYILSGAILAEYRPSIQIKNTEVCTLGKGEKKIDGRCFSGTIPGSLLNERVVAWREVGKRAQKLRLLKTETSSLHICICQRLFVIQIWRLLKLITREHSKWGLVLRGGNRLRFWLVDVDCCFPELYCSVCVHKAYLDGGRIFVISGIVIFVIRYPLLAKMSWLGKVCSLCRRMRRRK